MPSNYISEKDRQEYGEEFIDLVKRGAQEATATELAQLKQATVAVQQELRKVKVAEMKKAMDARLPGWRQQNDDPGFLAWLEQRDVYSGQTRNALLQHAWNSGDASRVANIFEGYRREAQAQPRPDPYPGYGRQQQGSPGTLWPLGTRGPITTKQIDNFHRMVVEGRFAHNPQEKQQRDAEIVQAAREGRVVN